MTIGRLRAASRAEKWQLDYLFDLSFQAWLVHIGVVTAVMALLVYVWPDEIWPFVWYAAMCAFSGGLAALAWRYTHRRPADEREARPYGLAHTALTTLVGITWGLGAFGAATGDFHHLLVYSLALGGTALGAVSSQHVLPRSCIVSLWTSVPLLGFAHIFHDPGFFGATIFGMIMLYAGVLSILTVRMLRFMRTNVDLTRSLDAKLGEITEMAAELEEARHEAVEANLSKSRFLAHASHDLRQPIHAIGLFTACLRDLEPRIEIEEGLRLKAKQSLDRMLEMASGTIGNRLVDLDDAIRRAAQLGLAEVLLGIGSGSGAFSYVANVHHRITHSNRLTDCDCQFFHGPRKMR